MCFNIHFNYPNAIIATKDIQVRKQLTKLWDDTFMSPHQGEEYWKCVSIKPAIKFAKFGLFCNDFGNKWYIGEGLHSYSIEYTLHHDDYIGIIPKGTAYYYNPDDMEYVSEKLIVFQTTTSYLLYKFKKLFNLK